MLTISAHGALCGESYRVVQRRMLPLGVVPKTEQVPQLENAIQSESCSCAETRNSIENHDKLQKTKTKWNKLKLLLESDSWDRLMSMSSMCFGVGPFPSNGHIFLCLTVKLVNFAFRNNNNHKHVTHEDEQLQVSFSRRGSFRDCSDYLSLL